jgi:hypothetical protein
LNKYQIHICDVVEANLGAPMFIEYPADKHTSVKSIFFQGNSIETIGDFRTSRPCTWSTFPIACAWS